MISANVQRQFLACLAAGCIDEDDPLASGVPEDLMDALDEGNVTIEHPDTLAEQLFGDHDPLPSWAVEAVLGDAWEYPAAMYYPCHMQTDEFTATLSPCFCRFQKRLQRTPLHAPIATDARSFQLPRLDESLNRLPGELQPTSDLLCGQQGLILSFRALGCFDWGLLARHRPFLSRHSVSRSPYRIISNAIISSHAFENKQIWTGSSEILLW
jgi:hypothetical protein